MRAVARGNRRRMSRLDGAAAFSFLCCHQKVYVPLVSPFRGRNLGRATGEATIWRKRSAHNCRNCRVEGSFATVSSVEAARLQRLGAYAYGYPPGVLSFTEQSGPSQSWQKGKRSLNALVHPPHFESNCVSVEGKKRGLLC